MKKLSSRAVSTLTNCFLSLVVLLIGVICFFPSVSATSGVDGRVYYKGNSRTALSVMFNVYENAQTVEGILAVLEKKGVKATFFLGGCWADDNVECVQKIAQSGHEIASHGYFHREHDKLSYKGNFDEIKVSVDYLSKISGKEITLFAPPSGAYNEKTLDAALALGLKTVMWSKDTIDWRDKDVEVCFTRATKNARGGDLILMHPKEHTLSALPRILDYYKEQGLGVIPVGENLLAEGNT